MHPVKSLAAAALLAVCIAGQAAAQTSTSTSSTFDLPGGGHRSTSTHSDGSSMIETCEYINHGGSPREYRCETTSRPAPTAAELEAAAIAHQRAVEIARANPPAYKPPETSLCPPPHKMTARDGCQ